MQLYRFSPIRTEEELFIALRYILESIDSLSAEVCGSPLPASYVTVFAHYPEEYEGIVQIFKKLGVSEEANNGIKVALGFPLADGSLVTSVRVRKPDPYRMQVGCGDFYVSDYAKFKEKYLGRSDHVRLIERPEYEMIEFFDPDVDVLGYVVSK